MDGYSVDKVLSEQGVCSGDSVLVACSGGADSISLLHLLINSKLDLNCIVAHVNFNLRGDESNADEQFVTDFCSSNGVKLYVHNVNTITYAKERQLSIEMAAREIRYNWFYKLLEENSIKFLAVAHNADDNAETLFLNLTRGTGLKGLCGIPKENGAIIRPLLSYSRAQIEKYLSYHRLEYRTDHTNLESDYSRNKIRNIVFPQLKKINPSLISTLNRNIEYFSMANSIIEEMFIEIRSKIVDQNRGVFQCERVIISNLLELPQWQYWLFIFLQEYGFNSAQCKDLSSILVEPLNGAKKIESNSHILVVERGAINLYSIDFSRDIEKVEVLSEGEYQFGNYKVVVKSENCTKELLDRVLCSRDSSADSLYLDADKIEFPLLLRAFEKGDKFIPYGMKGQKKISDLFTDIKIDHIMRKRVPLLIDSSSNIICVPSIRIDNRYKLKESTKRVLVVTRKD